MRLPSLSAIPALGALLLGACAERAPSVRDAAPPDPPNAVADMPATASTDSAMSGARPLADGETLGLLPFPFDSITPLPEGASNLTSCRRSGRWQIASRGFDDQVGTDLFIRPAASGSCATDSLPGDLVIRNQEADYFEATWEDRLFVDSGTGPDGRGLTLYELPSGRRLVGLTIAEGVFRSTEPHEILVWTQHDLRETAPGCTRRESMIPVIDSLVRVDLRTGAVTRTGTTRCSAWS